ncbi:MAG: histidinol dehydrogenase [Acidobacteria bacterium]|nr:histidinol dehydrogenase [Acidobacteriota bacterium]
MIEIVNLIQNPSHPRLYKILNRGLALDSELLSKVANVIEQVRLNGDQALCDFTQSFDGIATTPANLRVEPDLIKTLASQVSSQLIGFIQRAIENVKLFHKHQIEKSWQFTDEDGVTLGQRLAPLDSVGLYVPGGKAAYPTTLIMNAVPAITAGVKRIVVVTPPTTFMSSPVIAATLNELNLTEVYSVGGSQAIAALAFGTDILPKVDKIVGPGNIYVTAAKKLLYGTVDIDSIAGPSEIVVLSNPETPARFVAADLLSQAEHDPDSSAILITTNAAYAREVQLELQTRLLALPRREIAERSITNYGAIFVVGSIEQACHLVNRIAPEHVEVMINDEEKVAESITHAGAIFLGSYSCEAVGDYIAGPNHVLPTGGTARFFSPLGVYDFLKRTNIIKYNKTKLEKSIAAIVGLAESEGLTGHARAALVRFEMEQDQSRATRPLAIVPGMKLPFMDE